MNSMLELRTNLKTTLQQLLPEAVVTEVDTVEELHTQESADPHATIVTFVARRDDSLTLGIGALDYKQIDRDASIVFKRLAREGVPLEDGTLICFAPLEVSDKPNKKMGCTVLLIDFDLIPLMKAGLAA